MKAKDLLANPEYRAISYGGYRLNSREYQPTIPEIKEDLKILHALGIRILRTYNVHFAQAGNVLQAIQELREDEAAFEMYVMLGTWINCAYAFTDNPDHDRENTEGNQNEIDTAVILANQYPEIVKIIAVGNEAMVKWAERYFVQPWVILKYVNYLQDLKKSGRISKDVWITSSDNFASWGGGEPVYHVDDLEQLYHAVDFISLHTYPMHDTHHNPNFWGVKIEEQQETKKEQIEYAMQRALEYAIQQFNSTKEYMQSLNVNKPLHIGETGWASSCNGLYGADGSRATDEYKEGVYHRMLRAWTDAQKISCFYFEAFDEPWKDAGNPGGSENYFGLITVGGKAKYALWDQVDKGIFNGMTRGGRQFSKTYNGSETELMLNVSNPPSKVRK